MRRADRVSEALRRHPGRLGLRDRADRSVLSGIRAHDPEAGGRAAAPEAAIRDPARDAAATQDADPRGAPRMDAAGAGGGGLGQWLAASKNSPRST